MVNIIQNSAALTRKGVVQMLETYSLHPFLFVILTFREVKYIQF